MDCARGLSAAAFAAAGDAPMNIADVLVHVGYVLMLCALLARDVLWLRGLLVVAQGTLSTYAFTHGVPEIGMWNALFVVINALWVLVILRERRAVRLPPELQRWHERAFAALPASEFLALWRLGEDVLIDHQRLTQQGQPAQWLWFVVDGELSVRRQDREVTRLRAGDFVGEMGLVTGAAASADVVAQGAAQLRRWALSDLRALRRRRPEHWARVQSVLGRDLVEKLRRSGQGGGTSSSPGASGATSGPTDSSGTAGSA